MSVRLHYTNLIDATGVVFSETSEQTDLPSSNVANAHRSQVWRTGTSVALEAVVFDLLSAKAVTSVCVLDHTLLAGDSLIKIQGNATDSWGAPSYSNTLAWSADAIYAVFASQSYRYWRLTFTKASSGVTRDVGRIFLGVYTTLDRDPDFEGYEVETVDLSNTRRALGGQSYTWARDSYVSERYTFSKIAAAMKTQVEALTAAVGTHTPFFLYYDGAHTVPQYVKLSRLPKFPNAGGVAAALIWNTQIQTDEEL